MNILIIGATGQLGYTITKKLFNKKEGHSIYASHRKNSNIKPLEKFQGIGFREIDLSKPETVASGLKDIDILICTANTAVPTQKSDNFKNIDENGIKTLIDEAKKQNVKQFIFVSALPFAKWDDKVPLTKAKRAVEKHLISSDIIYTIIQPTAFMEVYFPYMGTEITMNHSEVNTIQRPFKFANDFYNGIRKSMEEKDTINIVGKGNSKCSYISLENVADFCVNAIDNTKAYHRVIPIGGPDVLSAMEVKSLFEKVYQKPLKVKSTPPFVMRIMSGILSPFNKAASNIMAMNYVMATSDAIVTDMDKKSKEFGVEMISAEKFLKEKTASV
jgi:uncharacterized protein YbjT (DUF2867 family)